jgi:hypothetical protein
MAERRMFAKTIIDSDAFLDMPTSTQLLYFHLGMRADDDGFINKPKTIMRMINSSDDDMKVLITKKFVIPFETGVVVIKHWKIHNYIQNDRYSETKYKEEKEQLLLDENKAYKLVKTECIQNGYNTYTQDRLGKDRLGKVSLDQDNILSSDESNDEVSPLPYSQIIDLFNLICTDLPKVLTSNESRKKAIKSAFKDLKDISSFENLFNLVQDSDFLTGRDGKWTSCCFDWILKPSNRIKIIEGNYKNKNKKLTREEEIMRDIERGLEELANEQI